MNEDSVKQKTFRSELWFLARGSVQYYILSMVQRVCENSHPIAAKMQDKLSNSKQNQISLFYIINYNAQQSN